MKIKLEDINTKWNAEGNPTSGFQIVVENIDPLNLFEPFKSNEFDNLLDTVDGNAKVLKGKKELIKIFK